MLVLHSILLLSDPAISAKSVSQMYDAETAFSANFMIWSFLGIYVTWDISHYLYTKRMELWQQHPSGGGRAGAGGKGRGKDKDDFLT